jgi:23S rRNA (cytosine1962-C5)-methyltransferase
VTIARVNRKGVARWRRGHPWIFRSDLIEPPPGPPGPVIVQDERGTLIGSALWSPLSQISLRMLTSDDRPIDRDFWKTRLSVAIEYRNQLSIPANAYRLVHGEADGIPSLIVDRYENYLVVQVLSAGLEACRSDILNALIDAAGPAGVLARNDVSVRKAEGLAEAVELLHGTVPETIELNEHGIRYQAAPWTGQKTGSFLDQRENRVRCGELARGRGLDCFSYHGSFALHLARNASEVIALDSSGPALERARANALINGFQQITTVEANVFDYLRAQESTRERFDVIVVDPPAFAKRRDAVEQALRAYKEVNLRAMKLLSEGGILATFSCSHHVSALMFREMIESAAADVKRPLRWLETRGQAPDHPEIVQIPESAYLKGAILQAV